MADHYYQTFLWAKRAVDAGDASLKSLMALGIDRYLVATGHRQLFGSQAHQAEVKPGACWCLQATERSFPDSLRRAYVGKTYADYVAWVRELNQGKTCPAVPCPESLRPSPKGSLPGFW